MSQDYTSSRLIYEETARELARLIVMDDSGPYPYRCPWHGFSVPPHNPLTGRFYMGLNHIILWRAQYEKNLVFPFWASEKAWSRLGASIRDHDQSVSILIPVTEDVGTPLHHASGRREGYGVVPKQTGKLLGFTGGIVYPYEAMDKITLDAQCDAVMAADYREDLDRLIGSFLKREGIEYCEKTGGIGVYYPGKDRIVVAPLPPSPTLEQRDFYRTVLIHEMIHATQHPNRCRRVIRQGQGGLSFAEEELIAEIGTSMLCARMGVPSYAREDHRLYVPAWISRLSGPKNDVCLTTVFSAASRAVDYIMRGFHYGR